jgi:hypothetical protein
MAEPFRFNYAEVSLSNFLQNRELNEQQRQFDLEQSRIQRQESLMNFFRQREDMRQETELNFNMNKVEPETYLYQVDAPTPYKAGVKARISAKGNYFKDATGKLMIDSPAPDKNSADIWEDISSGSQGTGDYKGQTVDIRRNKITGEERQIPKAIQEDGLSKLAKALTINAKQREEQEAKDRFQAGLEKDFSTVDAFINAYRTGTEVIQEAQPDKSIKEKNMLKVGNSYIDPNLAPSIAKNKMYTIVEKLGLQPTISGLENAIKKKVSADGLDYNALDPMIKRNIWKSVIETQPQYDENTRKALYQYIELNNNKVYK